MSDPEQLLDETHEQRLARLGIDDFTNKVWCLIFSMRERGITGQEPWWGQDFLGVKQMLEEKGLNCDPEKVDAPIPPPAS